jgi:hypothetical protein
MSEASSAPDEVPERSSEEIMADMMAITQEIDALSSILTRVGLNPAEGDAEDIDKAISSALSSSGGSTKRE